MFSNCRSVRNKLPYLELILSSNIYDIVCLVETFLTNVDTDAFSFLVILTIKYIVMIGNLIQVV